MSSRPPERRQLTVLLCDLVGWTALAQRIDAEELADVVRAYRQRCAALVVRHGGMVAQYVGDAVLAYFGYPRAHEDDAERAIRTALGIVAAERPAAAGGGSGVHIGIATGVVVVGDLAGGGAPRAGAPPETRRARKSRRSAVRSTSPRGCRGSPARARSWSPTTPAG